MNLINYEENLKNQYLLEINSLENAKGVLDFQINQLKYKISEIENKKNLRMYVKNNTPRPIFIGNFKIIDFVTKKSFLENVSTAEAERLYEMGDIEDVDRNYYLNNKKELFVETEQHKNIKLTPSAKKGILDEVFMGVCDKEPLAVELDISGVKNIEEKNISVTKNLDDSIGSSEEANRLLSRFEKGISINDMKSLGLGISNNKLELKEKNKAITGKNTSKTVQLNSPAKKSISNKKTELKKEKTIKRNVEKTKNSQGS